MKRNSAEQKVQTSSLNKPHAVMKTGDQSGVHFTRCLFKEKHLLFPGLEVKHIMQVKCLLMPGHECEFYTIEESA